MRTIADPYTRILCMRIVPSYGGSTIRVTQYPHPIRMENSDAIYTCVNGIEFSDFELSANFTPAVIELSGSTFDGGISRERLLRGELDGSRMYLFATSWADPQEDEEPLGTFILGKADLDDTEFKIECVHIIDAFNIDVNVKYTKDCNNTFCDVTPNGQRIPFSVCGLDIADWETTGTLVAVDSETKTVTRYDAGGISGEDFDFIDNYFVPGYIQFQFENELGETVWTPPFSVTAYTNGALHEAEITLLSWALYDITVGMTYRLRPDCDKAFVTCRDKYDNIFPESGGFLGFPNPPTTRNG